MRRFCQLIFLRCSVAEGRIVFSIVSSLFSSPRLVGRLVAILCGSPVVPSCSSIRSAVRCPVSSGGPVPRLVHRSSVFRLTWFIVPVSSARLVRSSRQAVRILSFRPAARGVGSCPCVSFFSVLVVYRSLRLMAMTAAARLSHLVAAGSRPRCLPSWNPIGLMAVAE